MSFIDWATLVAGILGLALITIGAWMIYPPAGFIIAGSGLLTWSYIISRAMARAGAKG
ncbi:hypothetical protein [Massilia timonae]|uniref:Putative membrane protein n=1 Tax=Massilia timonae TaxID=47229 RepID=A0A1S2N7Z8_9BURK|nr:hypothetical protein [Massilia timonae]OIJ40940.1 putative membrane protein [Massilia timonae]